MENDFKSYLASVIQFEVTGTGVHEWVFNEKKQAVRIANYLRSFGYKITYRHYLKGWLDLHYVGVLKEDIKGQLSD